MPTQADAAPESLPFAALGVGTMMVPATDVKVPCERPTQVQSSDVRSLLLNVADMLLTAGVESQTAPDQFWLNWVALAAGSGAGMNGFDRRPSRRCARRAFSPEGAARAAVARSRVLIRATA